MSQNINPLVSIICLCYNHGKYLEDAINGFLQQKVNFSYEIIIHDDASTDGSDLIIKNYKNLFPDIIKPIYQKVNQYKLEKGRISKIVINASKGKYLSFCEADDYWTDPHKLQRQVSILNTDPNLSGTFSNASIFFVSENIKKMFHENFGSSRKLTEFEVVTKGGAVYPTTTLLFKKEALDINLFGELIHDFAGDVALIFSLLRFGPIYYENVNTAVYRRWSGGVYSSNKKNYEYLIREKINEINGLRKMYALGFSKLGLKTKISNNVYQVFKISGFRMKLLPLLSFHDFFKYLKFKIKEKISFNKNES
jgi:glycosyltransferase involved in cell wall biosynthesis